MPTMEILGMSKEELAMPAFMFFLRLVQMTNIAITGFCVGFLIYMHNHHPCGSRYYSCINDYHQVPATEVVMVTIVSTLMLTLTSSRH